MINNYINVTKIFRGYKKIKSMDTYFLSNLKDEIANIDLQVSNADFQKYFNLKIDQNYQIILKQFLITEILDHWFFNKHILKFYGNKDPVTLPLCQKWINLLQNKGILISNIRSSFYFVYYLHKKILKALIQVFSELISTEKFSSKSYIQLMDISENCIPKYQNSFDIISWIENHYSKNYHFSDVIVNCNVKHFDFKKRIISKGNKIHPALNLKQKFKFFFWSCLFFFGLFKDLLRGNWFTSVLSYECILAKKVEIIDSDKLAREYFYSWSQYAFRPLWTYFSEKRNSKVTMYCYGSNIPFYISNGKPISNHDLKFMTWNLLVWTEKFKEFILNNCQFVNKIEKYKFIYHTDSYKKIHLDKSKRYIAVFDILPFRSAKIAELGYSYYITDFRNLKKFLEDIVDVAKYFNYEIILKNKRPSHYKTHNHHYTNFIDKLNKKKDIELISSDHSANKIISLTDLSISFPFTSAGLIGEIYGKKSIYYDPFSTVLKNDRAAQYTEVVSGKDELVNFFKKLTSN